MITVDQIPYEVKKAMRAAWARRNNSDAPEKHMADLAVAALNAWPGMSAKQADEHVALFNSQPALILPLPTEARDE